MSVPQTSSAGEEIRFFFTVCRYSKVLALPIKVVLICCQRCLFDFRVDSAFETQYIYIYAQLSIETTFAYRLKPPLPIAENQVGICEESGAPSVCGPGLGEAANSMQDAGQSHLELRLASDDLHMYAVCAGRIHAESYHGVRCLS